MTGPLADGWWRPLARSGSVDVVYVDLSSELVSEQTAWSRLDGDERSRARRFRNQPARRRYVLCRAALRALLCDALACGNKELAFRTAKHGKPHAIVDGRRAAFSFNVSHSGRHGLIALAPGGRLGVDVEQRSAQRNLDSLIAAALGPRERAEAAAVSGEARLRLFLDLWVMKEALTKALGMGLSMDVTGIEIPAEMRNGARDGLFRFSSMPEIGWRLQNLGTDAFAAAVAHEAASDDEAAAWHAEAR